MSIYHHFPSKQHLLDALVEHAIGSVHVPEPGPDIEARTRASLESYRDGAALAGAVPAGGGAPAQHAGRRSLHRIRPAPHPRADR
jgi:AcrR family transcriptional regulator